jgi:hypothetical protein
MSIKKVQKAFSRPHRLQEPRIRREGTQAKASTATIIIVCKENQEF